MKSNLHLQAILFTLLMSSKLQAESIVFDFNGPSKDTISGLGTSFIIGCALLAIGLIVAAKIFKSK